MTIAGNLALEDDSVWNTVLRLNTKLIKSKHWTVATSIQLSIYYEQMGFPFNTEIVCYWLLCKFVEHCFVQ